MEPMGTMLLGITWRALRSASRQWTVLCHGFLVPLWLLVEQESSVRVEGHLHISKDRVRELGLILFDCLIFFSVYPQKYMSRILKVFILT